MSSVAPLALQPLDSPPTLNLPHQSDNPPAPLNSTDTKSNDLITQRIIQLQSLLSTLHAYRETIPAIIEAYKSGKLTIEPGQLTFWTGNCQLGPVRKFDVPTTEDERLGQQVKVMGMLDEMLKVQDRGDLLWIENGADL
ncbi:hypothetical protein TSTA_104530 [Talaromyces stipitatus ATCC 10500]|uniref:Uncharacterized protein n=1 Tax=Talaromyces stipitatus (strain ATCC 10500 / CBS 375.48 / QM 6759 / NRRL 1006) TaxID=441959 RepID=B8MNZ9_TALSN|nr:uncharacterized protein TSTA_104530 [Talaromyces stipitatus ATCC 10500]EED14237.1 hypothetical protein TSTA_104530 [Talaromyces stipitatus ATCC 10500]